MCMVSQIHDYGKGIQPNHWTIPGIQEYRKVVDAAEIFDAANGEPECVDPEKQKLMDKLAAIELRLWCAENGGNMLRWVVDKKDETIIRETVEPYNKVECSTKTIARVVAGYLNDEYHE